MTKAEALAQSFDIVAERLDQFVWTHGTSAHLEDPNASASVVRRGTGIAITGTEGTTITVHFALPTPLILKESRLSIRSVILDFIGGELTRVSEVQVWDGRRLITSFEDLNFTGEHRFEKFEIEGHPAFNRGINVAVKVAFVINGGASTTIEFISAGAEFVTKTGGLFEGFGG